MPYVTVHVDADDILDELSDQELRDELASRQLRKGGQRMNDLHDYMIIEPQARQALNDAADFLLRQGLYALAFKLEEIREDYLAKPEPIRKFNYFKTEKAHK